MNQPSKIYRSGRHCVFNLHAHLVFTPKYRRKVFKKKYLQTMETIFQEICELNDVMLAEFNGEADHVHLLINYPTKLSLSKFVNTLKGVSSRRLRTLYPEIKKMCYKNVLWSRSYFAASCGGPPLSILKEYIQQQNTPE